MSEGHKEVKKAWTYSLFRAFFKDKMKGYLATNH